MIYGTKGTLTGLDLGMDGVSEREALNAAPPANRERLIEGHANELLLYFHKMAYWIVEDKEPTPSGPGRCAGCRCCLGSPRIPFD